MYQNNTPAPFLISFILKGQEIIWISLEKLQWEDICHYFEHVDRLNINILLHCQGVPMAHGGNILANFDNKYPELHGGLTLQLHFASRSDIKAEN